MTTRQLPNPTPIWECKIGIIDDGSVNLPPACDVPMREAVQRAYLEITGREAEFTFSGWSAELTEPELAVVEDRLPLDV